MRELALSAVTAAVKALFLKANYQIGQDVHDKLCFALQNEPAENGQDILRQIIKNNRIAHNESIAICQDTGMALVFAEIGQEIHLTGGCFEDAVQQGVREAYKEGFLRKSIVKDPVFERVNTGDNTPALIYTRLVPGDKAHLTAVAKGFGSENMSRLQMLMPSDGLEGVKRFILESVMLAGPNACPPMIIGVGIGGSFDSCALMAKKASALPLDHENEDARYRALENELLEEINQSGIGPSGIGGKTTALKLHILSAPTHIAGLPVAVNICCHASRHAQIIL